MSGDPLTDPCWNIQPEPYESDAPGEVDPVDDAAVESDTELLLAASELERNRLEAALAEARASLEEWRVKAQTAEGDASGQAAQNISLRRQVREAVARADLAEADLSACREALEEITSGPDASKGEDYGCLDLHEARHIAREALSRLDHSSEEER